MHKNWCDKETEKTAIMKTDKETKRDELTADIDSLNAELSSLAQGIKDNNEAVALLEAQIEEETAERNADKAENAATVKDAQEAQTAIASAIAVLEDFYKSTGGIAKEAWEAFVQVRAHTHQDPEPELWEAQPYTGTDGGSGVVGMLTDIASDFASMDAEARSDETTQQDQYDEWLTTAQVDESARTKDNEMMSARRETMKEKLEGKTTDHAHNAKELEATDKYLTDLQHACVDGDSTYGERKAARQQEIDALHQAQGILE